MISATRPEAVIGSILLVFFSVGCSGRQRGDDDDDDVTGRDAGPDGLGDAGAGPDGGDELGDGGSSHDAAVPDEGCDPTAPLGALERDLALSASEDGEPWISGDGLTAVLTHVDEDFNIGLEMAFRNRRGDAFSAPAPVTLGSWDDGASQGSLSPDGDALYFMQGAEILRAAATGNPLVFSEPTVVDAGYPEYTDYPEFPRFAAGSLYYSQRELNHRRSLYAHDLDSGVTEAILYDAGDIFTFAISPNGRFVYVTFSVDTLETYRAERASPDRPLSAFEPVDAFAMNDPNLIGFAVTGVTDDDCEVYGWTYDLSGTDSVWRARRGR